MAAGKINLQANDGKVLGLIAPDGMSASKDAVVATLDDLGTKVDKVDTYTKSEADSRFVNVTGDTMTGNLAFTDDAEGIVWVRNSDGASIKFYNTSDSDTNSRLEFNINDNNNEDFLWTSTSSGKTTELMRISPDDGNTGLKFRGNTVWHAGNDGSGSGLDADKLDGLNSTDFLRSNANAVSATKLATARTINGVAFDGTADITIADNTKLGATAKAVDSDKLDGLNSTDFLRSNANAVSATKLATARTIGLSGDVSGSVSFDGSSNATITATVADNSHTHDDRYYTESEVNTKLGTKTDKLGTGHENKIASFDANGNIKDSGVSVGSFGKVLQVVTLQSPNARYYYNQSSTVAIPGLTTTITPKSNNSTFLIFATVNGAISHVNSGNVRFRGAYTRNSGNSNCDGNTVVTRYIGGHTHDHMNAVYINEAVRNNSTAPAEIIIGIRQNWNGGQISMYINDRKSDDMRALSSAIIMEVQN